MIAGCCRAIVLVAVLALICNAQCFGNCVSASCNNQRSAPKHCHHRGKTDSDLSRCSHQHFDFTNPDAGFAKIGLMSTPSLPLLPMEFSGPAWVEHSNRLALNTGPPPANRSDSFVAVLRI